MSKPTITEDDLTEREILLEILRYVRSIAWIFYVAVALGVLLFVATAVEVANTIGERG